MDREIKFRVWSTLSKKMYYSGFSVKPNGHVMGDGSEISNDHLAAGWKIYENEGELILQQFTGLKDKNGKDICEGDILEIFPAESFKHPLVVSFGEYSGDGYYDERHWGWVCKDGAAGEVTLIDSLGRNIIGNIFENPELLK